MSSNSSTAYESVLARALKPGVDPVFDAALARERERRAQMGQMRVIERDLEASRARCVTFAGFVREAWPILEPATPLRWNWHLDVMCALIEAITFGRISPWWIINVSPGSSKSMIISVLWQAWVWGPCALRSKRFLTTSFEEGNVKRDTRKTRDLIASAWFQERWPAVQFSRRGELSFANTETGTREGVPFASVMGKRGDIFTIDDPHSLKGAESETDRENTVRRFIEGGLNRVNDAQTSAIVVVMQRIHERDLSGALLADDFGFRHLMIPMEFEPARAFDIPELGLADPRTEDGELMDPVRFPIEAVNRLKKGGQYMWAGQYQQRPAPRDGGLFKRHWFQPIHALPAGHRKRVRAWDLAASKKEATNNPDWTAGVRVSKGAEGLFIIERATRFRDSAAEVRKTLKTTAASDGTQTMIRLTQDPGQAGKDQIANLVRELAGYAVVHKLATGDKETRAQTAAVQAEAGNVRILVTGDPALDAWIEPFLDEVCLFPTGAKDDQVDALADAINELALGSRYTLNNL